MLLGLTGVLLFGAGGQVLLGGLDLPAKNARPALALARHGSDHPGHPRPGV
ncbi:hypothetical protein [Streptomyces sp. G7(2002)]|uniref:hypothetical protein n=1 Tax=Streptomyces sp. G7(2002) TaxID=2971798 RepID=UPI00237D3D7E|nr:hypothetical protein [Streptomyces sp. G7(2002)]WDT59725.1 hypothetical protein NUT86_40035 [Streptomyces sp. G7(2002)]